MLEVVADVNGLCVMPYYDDEIITQGGWSLVINLKLCSEDMVTMLAEKILEDTKSMFPVEISRYIKDKGLE